MERQVDSTESVEDNINPQPLTRSQKIKKTVFLLVGLLAFNAFVWGTLYYSLVLSNNQKNEAKKAIENKFTDLKKIEVGQVDKDSESASFAFQEITIPYLREREYKSSLKELVLNSQNESYKSYLTSYDSDGLKINAQITIPEGIAPEAGWPAIVFVHGYIPPQEYQTLGKYVSYVDYLARNGYVVFKIDLRGHGESEGEPGGAYYSSDYVVDTLNARAALQESDFVNPEKIGLWGHSMAGNVVTRSLAASPEIPAVVVWAGAVYTYEDLASYRIQDASYRPPNRDSGTISKREELFQTYGTFNKNSEFWKKVPMTNYLEDIKGAISINHSVDDSVVNIGYSRNFKKILDKTSIPHELNEYLGGGHNIAEPYFSQAMQNTVKFFDKYLKQ